MKQFDIYSTVGGTYSTKPRPSVIIQSLGFEEIDSVTIIPITAVESNLAFRVQIMPSNENGLDSVSFVMIDKLTTIKKASLGNKIGHLDMRYIDDVKTKLLMFIGLDKSRD